MIPTYIDIETIPQQPEGEAKSSISGAIKAPAAMKVQATIDDWHNGVGKYAGAKDKAIDEQYRKTSFDGSKGQICSIAFAVGDGEVKSFNDGDGEGAMLASAFESLSLELESQGHTKRTPYFVGHYISGFDLKFLFHRLVINNINPGVEIPHNGRHGNSYFDTMIEWSGYKGSISQDNLCKALGIEGKPADIDGSKVWDFYKDGKIGEIEAYNRDDIEKCRMVFKRLQIFS